MGRGKAEVGSSSSPANSASFVSSANSANSASAQLVGDPGELEADDYRRRYEDLLRERAAEMREAASRVRSESTGRRQAEAEALASEERFRVLVEHSSDLILIVDAQARIVYCSPSVERLLGYRQDEITGRLADELIHGDDLAPINAFRARHHLGDDALAHSGDHAAGADPALATDNAAGTDLAVTRDAAGADLDPGLDGDPDRGTLRVATRDGELRWFEWTASSHFDDEAIGGIVVNARDVTDRVLAERELRASELRYRTLTEASADTIYVIGADLRVQYVNGEGARRFGVAADELVGSPLTELFGGITGARVAAAVEGVLRTGETHETEALVAYPDGERCMSTRLVALRDHDGGIDTVVGVSHDVTARRSAQEALGESERRYRSLFEDSPVALWEEDHSAVKARLEELLALGVDDIEAHLRAHPDEYTRCVSLATTLDVNHAAVALSGAASRRELLDNQDSFYGDTYTGGLASFWAAALAGRRTTSYEETNLTLKGREIQVMETCIVAPGHEDTFDRVYIADVDMSEHRRSEELLLRYRLLFAEAADVMWFVRAGDGAIVEANAAAEAAYGYTREELLRLRIADLRVNESAAEIERQLGRAAAGGILFETEHRRKDGSVFPVEVSSRGIATVEGGTVLLSVVRDITTRKRTESELAKATGRLEGTLEGAVVALGTTSELRDPYTAGHQRRVAELACAIAAELGWDEGRIATLRTAALLHDLGKMVVPAEILSKPGKLTDIEFLLIHQHSAAGAEILAGIDFGADVAAIVRQHHERLDGSGYPDGLSDGDIVPAARVLAVADVVEAMVSHRPYRAGLPLDVALDEIEQGAGRRYDAAACTACRRLMRELQFAFSRPD